MRSAGRPRPVPPNFLLSRLGTTVWPLLAYIPQPLFIALSLAVPDRLPRSFSGKLAGCLFPGRRAAPPNCHTHAASECHLRLAENKLAELFVAFLLQADRNQTFERMRMKNEPVP
jgi:hypothetical protein